MDTDQVKVVYRHFIVVGPESALAAEAADCAAEQGLFFPYHDLLFQQQGPENTGYLTEERLASFAAEAGLDTTAFSQCLASDKYHTKVEQLTQEGQQIGVRGTPTVFVNGRRVEDPMNLAELRQVILDELERRS